MNVIDRGNRAKALLDDEVFKEALSDVQQAIIGQWMALPVSDKDTAYKLKISLSLLGNLEANLNAYVEDGKLEEFRIEEEKRPSHLGELSAWMRSKT